MAGGFFLMSLAPSLLSLGLLFGVAIGLGAAALGPLGASKVVANWFVHRRGRALGIAAVGTSVGGLHCTPTRHTGHRGLSAGEARWSPWAPWWRWWPFRSSGW